MPASTVNRAELMCTGYMETSCCYSSTNTNIVLLYRAACQLWHNEEPIGRIFY